MVYKTRNHINTDAGEKIPVTLISPVENRRAIAEIEAMNGHPFLPTEEDKVHHVNDDVYMDDMDDMDDDWEDFDDDMIDDMID